MTRADLGPSSTASKHLFGYTYGAASPYRHVLLITGQHGQEHLGMYAAMRWFHQFVKGTHPLMGQLRDRIRVTFVPVANPTSYGKSSPNPRLNANAVDLNRNWDYLWSSYTPSGADDYKGTSVMSEPETQAIAALVTSNTIGIDCHNFGPTPGTELQYIEQPASLASQTPSIVADGKWRDIYGTPAGFTLTDTGATGVPFYINHVSNISGKSSLLIEGPSEMFGSIATIGTRYYASRQAVQVYAGLITEFLKAAVL